MGRISKKNIISGSIANLVFRDLGGKQIVQSHPGSLKQTQATKASSSEFRQCSSWARQLRMGLTSFLAGQTDSYMYRRLTGQLYNALLGNTHLPKGERTPLNASMKDLEGFDFNIHSPFKDYFAPGITTVMDAERQLHITVPALDPGSQMLFPRGVYNAELLVLAYATHFKYNASLVDVFFTLPMERHVAIAQKTVWTSPPLPEGCLVMVTAKVLYYTPDKFMGRKYSNSKTLNPATILFCDTTLP